MSPAAPPAPAGRAVLAAVSAGVVALGLGVLALVLMLAAEGETMGLTALALAVGLGLAVALAKPSPLARLVGVLLLQITQIGGEAGLSAIEVVAGLALVGYLAQWYVVALASARPLIRTVFDAAAVAWGTVGLVVAAGLGLMFGADAYDFRADLLATLPFLFYLPVKDLCVREDRGAVAIAAVLCAFGVAASLQNAVLFRNAISGAAALYEIADARFNVSEISITAGMLLALAGAAVARERSRTLGSVALAGLLLVGLLITKSRGYWIAGTFGILAMAVVVPGRGRRRIIGYGALGVGILVALAVLLFREQIVLVALGALDRLVSIGSATSDISILNRVAESAAVWERLRVNPILGYGWGVQVTHYSIIAEGTRSWAFFHNGYLSLWFKTGLWGVALFMSVWIGAMARAAWAARRTALPWSIRAPALGAGAAIAAFTPVVITSNPFAVLDQMLIVTLTLALAHGSADRAADLLRDA
ncbi:O-antigen ligase family protein [Rubrivirga sp. IMCC43871]|uniref:O-antigen ligase family protein n=1 Tax=Rubrivirga sp. IMCC43871 TaxID=3391575 RepID=UPI0039900A04